MDDALRRFLGTRGRIPYPVLPLFVRRPFLPATDVYAKDGDLIVRVELPGIDPREDVSVQVEGSELVVRGERKQQEEVKEEATTGWRPRSAPSSAASRCPRASM